MNKKILVAGLGNLLMGDDGAGCRAVELLQKKYSFPDNVDVMDLGTPGLSLASYIMGYDVVIFIDTVRDTFPPGTVRVYDKERILSAPLQHRVSPHDPALQESLMVAALSDNAPADAKLIGIVPEVSKYGIELSEAVQHALSAAAECVIRELSALDVMTTPL